MKSQVFSWIFYFVFTVAEAKYVIVRPENRTLYEDNKSHSNKEDVVEMLPKPSTTVQDCSHHDFLPPDPLLKPSLMSLAVVGLTKVSDFLLFNFKCFSPCFFTYHSLDTYMNEKDPRKKWKCSR